MKAIIITFLAGILLSAAPDGNTWTYLLDDNLSQWDTYLSYRHAIGYNGNIPKTSSGDTIPPLGYNRDEHKVFSIIDDHGERILRISGEIYGCIYTKQEYDNYHLKLKVKWGNRKDDPRKDKLKDSGIVYHSIGEAGVDYWRSWMLGQEFQIMEGHMGDYWNIASSAIDIRAWLPEGDMNSVASLKQPFLQFGTGANEGFCLRTTDHESNPGEWTTIELICYGDKSLHIVNGNVVMVLQNSRYVKDGKVIALTNGKIQIQSEAAEVFYKDISIRKLTVLPKQYTGLF